MSGKRGRKSKYNFVKNKKRKKQYVYDEKKITKQLKNIQFSIPSRDEIKNMAVVEVNNASTVVSIGLNNTLHDSRMGAFKNIKCETCKGTSLNCDGHFGLIHFIKPILNPLFQNTILKFIISNYCFGCFKKLKNCDCFEEIKNKKKKTPKIIKSQKSSNYRHLKLNYFLEDEPLSLTKLYNLVKQIDYKHSQNHVDATDSCFLHDLLVLPIACRTPNFACGAWNTSPISRLYGDIINKNNFLRMRENVVVDCIIDDLHNELQDSVNVLFDIYNTNRKLQTNVITNGGLRQRIDSKQGRIRLNLQGKRCEFSARTVLSGDPNIGINQVGIPRLVAQSLTKPVLVNQYNLHLIYNKYKPKYVIKKNGKKFDLNIVDVKIEIGDTIERELINGDIVAINRQPTLHRGSFLACRIVIFPTLTFRLNYSDLPSINGDCDGDELNLFVPQDLQSEAELEELMLASNNMVCSQANAPLMGLIQDALLGIYLLSKKKDVNRHDCMEYLFKSKSGAENYCDFKQKFYSGNWIISKILQSLKISFLHLKLENCEIFGSQITEESMLDKKIVGIKKYSLFHHVFLKYGHLKAAKLMESLQQVSLAFLDIHGFSVGIEDCVVKNIKKPNIKALNKILNKEREIDEEELVDALSSIPKMKHDFPANYTNSLLDMINAGSKGSIANFNQICTMVGQQIENNKRLPKQFLKGKRFAPHFNQNDKNLDARGFISSSYIQGLTPQEFYQHARTGRDGIISTSVKTSVTGSIQRRLVKSLESLQIDYGPKNSRIVKEQNTNSIISFNYGSDGLDGTYLLDINQQQI